MEFPGPFTTGTSTVLRSVCTARLQKVFLVSSLARYILLDHSSLLYILQRNFLVILVHILLVREGSFESCARTATCMLCALSGQYFRRVALSVQRHAHANARKIGLIEREQCLNIFWGQGGRE